MSSPMASPCSSWLQVRLAAARGDRLALATSSSYTVNDALADYWLYRAAKSPALSVEIDKSKAKAHLGEAMRVRPRTICSGTRTAVHGRASLSRLDVELEVPDRKAERAILSGSKRAPGCFMLGIFRLPPLVIACPSGSVFLEFRRL
jgi:hypothetical protein